MVGQGSKLLAWLAQGEIALSVAILEGDRVGDQGRGLDWAVAVVPPHTFRCTSSVTARLRRPTLRGFALRVSAVPLSKVATVGASLTWHPSLHLAPSADHRVHTNP